MADVPISPGAGALTFTTYAAGASIAYNRVPGYPPVAPWLPDEKQHRRDIARTLNNVLQGKQNVTLAVTLTANAASTTITDARIGVSTTVFLMPLTANAAAELGSVWFDTQLTGSIVAHHTNSANTDMSYRLLLIG